MSILEPREDVVIVDAVRSPLGPCRAGGRVTRIDAATLLAQTTSGLLDRARLEPAAVTKIVAIGGPRVDEVARTACSLAGLPPHRLHGSAAGPAAGSGLHTIARTVGRRDVVLVLGSSGARRSQPWSAAEVLDAERVAARWGLDRRDLDTYAHMSRERTREVAEAGEFGDEIVPVVAWSSQSCTVVAADETVGSPPRVRLPWCGETEVVRHPELGWHHHAGSVSQPAVGAAVTILVGHDRALELGIRPRARILAMADGSATETTAHRTLAASQDVLRHIGAGLDDLDHYEVRESFAAIPLAWCRELGADLNRFNPRGGSIGLGTLGPADGLRSLATALAALQATGGRLGLVASDDRNNTSGAVLLEYLQRPCCSRDMLDTSFSASAATERVRIPAPPSSH